MNLSRSVPLQKKVLLPVVERMIQQLDSVFVNFAGPVGPAVAEDIYSRWLLAGKTGPSGLRQYAYSLGMQLDDEQIQRSFQKQADELLTHLHSGYVN